MVSNRLETASLQLRPGRPARLLELAHHLAYKDAGALERVFHEQPWEILKWQGRRESNPQPTVLETATLPIELHPYSRGIV